MSTNLKRKSQFDKHDLALERGSLLRAETSHARWHSASPLPEVDATCVDTARSNAPESKDEPEEDEVEYESDDNNSIDENFGAAIRAKNSFFSQCFSCGTTATYITIGVFLATTILLIVVLVMPWEAQKSLSKYLQSSNDVNLKPFVVQTALEEIKQIENSYQQLCGPRAAAVGKHSNAVKHDATSTSTNENDYANDYSSYEQYQDDYSTNTDDDSDETSVTEDYEDNSYVEDNVPNYGAAHRVKNGKGPKKGSSRSRSISSSSIAVVPSVHRVIPASQDGLEALLNLPHVARPSRNYFGVSGINSGNSGRRLLQVEVTFDVEEMMERMTDSPEKVALITAGAKLTPEWTGLFSANTQATTNANTAADTQSTFSAVLANHLLWATEHGYHLLYYRFLTPKKNYQVRTTRGIESGVCKQAQSGWKSMEWCQLYTLLYTMTLVSPTQVSLSESTATLSKDCDSDMLVGGEEMFQDARDELGVVPDRACPIYEYLLFTDPSILIVANLSLPQILSKYILSPVPSASSSSSSSSSSPTPLPSLFFSSSTSEFTQNSPSTSLLFLRNTRSARQLLRSFLKTEDSNPLRSMKRAVRKQKSQQNNNKNSLASMHSVQLDANKYKEQMKAAQQQCEQVELDNTALRECMNHALSTPFVRLSSSSSSSSADELVKNEMQQRYNSRINSVKQLHTENEKRGLEQRSCDQRKNLLMNVKNFYEMKLLGKDLKVFPKA